MADATVPVVRRAMFSREASFKDILFDKRRFDIKIKNAYSTRFEHELKSSRNLEIASRASDNRRCKIARETSGCLNYSCDVTGTRRGTRDFAATTLISREIDTRDHANAAR